MYLPARVVIFATLAGCLALSMGSVDESYGYLSDGDDNNMTI